MSETRLAGKVGVFAALGIALVLVLLLSFSKGISVFTPTYELRLTVSSVGGLKPRSAVLMSGIPVGSVVGSDVAPGGKGVIIRLRIERKYQIHGDARFVIEQIGFLGDQSVGIYPQKNAAPLLAPGAVVPCEESFNIEATVRNTTALVNQVDELVKLLHQGLLRADRTVLSEESLTNLAEGIRNFRAISDRALVSVTRIDSLLQTNSPVLNTTLTNVLEFSGNLRGMAEELHKTFATNWADITSAVKNLEETSRALNGLVADVSAGKGVAGAVLRDDQIRTNFARLVTDAGILASNLSRYGLLYKPKPPKPARDPRANQFPGRNF
jgi:ABC-type transporter Mla subunit MlaD